MNQKNRIKDYAGSYCSYSIAQCRHILTVCTFFMKYDFNVHFIGIFEKAQRKKRIKATDNQKPAK